MSGEAMPLQAQPLPRSRALGRSPALRRARRLLGRFFLYAVVIAGAVLMLIPFLWMVSGSFKLEKDIFRSPPQWIPNPWDWGNYAEAWRALPFSRWLRNTLTIVFFAIIGVFLSCSLVAFGFARLRARGKNVLFLIMLSTLMLPSQVTLIPTYLLFSALKWVNTFKPLIVPAYFGSPFWIFMLRQFYMGIPWELDDAARIDGASTFYIYSKIMLPLTRPALTTLVVFTFMSTWNDFFNPLIYLNSWDKFTLAIGVNMFKGIADYQARYDLLMAASTVMSIPPLALFFLSQRYFVQGLALTGIKG